MKILKKLDKIASNETASFFILASPAIIGTLIFIIIPVLFSLWLSFTNWDLLGTPNFIGFKNYIELLTDKEFYFVMINTFYYALTVTVLGIIIPLIVAMLIDRIIKGSNLFKTAFFIPFITPMIVVGLVWQWIFDPQNGVLNWALGGIHLSWLYDKNLAMLAIIIISVWKNIGYNMIIFIAGLQAIPASLNEAAEIDGATGFKKFFNVTFPMLSPTIFFVSIITTISSFQVFDLIYLMTQGGPENSTNVVVYWLYKNAFELFKIGKASAIAYVLFFIILILTAIQWYTRKKWVYNED